VALRPVSYYFKEQDRARNPERNIGFVAQDVEPVLPNLVSGQGDEMRSPDYAGMSVVAIGAIQEQQKIIAAQEKQIAAQQEKIAALTDRLGRLERLLSQITADAAPLSDAGAQHLRANGR
jgi:ABC-type transporter Mla subunit MlaD